MLSHVKRQKAFCASVSHVNSLCVNTNSPLAKESSMILVVSVQSNGLLPNTAHTIGTSTSVAVVGVIMQVISVSVIQVRVRKVLISHRQLHLQVRQKYMYLCLLL